MGWQTDEPSKVTFFNLRVEPALVEGVQVMNDVHKLGSVEDIVSSMLDIGTDEAAHPIVGDHHRREYFQLAKGLKGGECKEDELFADVERTFSIVRF